MHKYFHHEKNFEIFEKDNLSWNHFLIPLFLGILILLKVKDIFEKKITPFVKQYGIEKMLGKAAANLVVIFILILLIVLVGF